MRSWFRWALWLTILWPPLAAADWVNLTGAEVAPNIAEIRVLPDRVQVDLEVYPDDLPLFETETGFTGFSISADSRPLPASIELREPRERVDRVSPYAGMIDPRTRRRIPGPPDRKDVVFFRLSYALPEGTSQLTLSPPMADGGTPAVTLGFLLYHSAVPVNDFRYLSRPETLTLNWDDPWFSRFENLNLTRHHRWPQMSFLYIEPREVRHEILVRARDLVSWMDLPITTNLPPTESEKQQIKEAAERFFRGKNPLSIDGKVAIADRFRAEFLDITPTGLQVFGDEVTLDISATLLGISLGYDTRDLPRTVTVDWELFDEQVTRLPTTVTDPAGPLPSYVTPDYPRIEWENFLKQYTNPLVRPVPVQGNGFVARVTAAWKGHPDDDVAAQAVRGLLGNLSYAFLERQPEALEQVLETLVANGQQPTVLPELRRVFAIPTTGGGVAGIERLAGPDVSEVSALEQRKGFRVLASWGGEAVGRHWGHIDQRRIGFRALMDLVEVDGDWKLYDLTVIEIRSL